MYKNKDKQREASKERMKRYRERKGITEGVTSKKGVTALEGKGVTYPDILDKLTDSVWRDRLGKICHAFSESHYPEYKEDVWLGDTNLSVVCDWLECTK